MAGSIPAGCSNMLAWYIEKDETADVPSLLFPYCRVLHVHFYDSDKWTTYHKVNEDFTCIDCGDEVTKIVKMIIWGNKLHRGIR